MKTAKAFKKKSCVQCGESYTPVGGADKRCHACREQTCAYCAKRFLRTKKTSVYCSPSCANAAKTTQVTRPCDQCGASVTRLACQIKRVAHIFCNPTCRSTFYWSQPTERARIIAAMKAGPYMSTPKTEQLNAARAKRDLSKPEYRAHLRVRRMKQRFPIKMTSIEQSLHDEFKKRRLHFDMHKTMYGRWQPDFVFESARLIVQADGSYWHSRPAAILNDAAFDKAASEDGWTVWRFSDTVIKRDAAACGQAVQRFIHAVSPHSGNE